MWQAAHTKAVLQAAGYQVSHCEDPDLFAGELQAFHPDLVLMDVLLPGTSGHELIRRLRGDERHATLPVIFLTTQAQARSRMETWDVGGDDHLVKPVPRGLLLSAVGGRLARSRRLREILLQDGLTHLLTQTALLDEARLMVERTRLTPGHRAVWVMIDLDHFKAVNDHHGHPTGDKVLTSAAEVLRRSVRWGDRVGRCGGEEFALLLEDLGTDEAFQLVERLRRDFAAIEHASGCGQAPFRATLSAGIAALGPRMSLEEWRSAADQALYAAKAAGRNRVEIARTDQAVKQRAAPRLRALALAAS